MRGAAREKITWESFQALKRALERRELKEKDYALLEKILSDWERLEGRPRKSKPSSPEPAKPPERVSKKGTGGNRLDESPPGDQPEEKKGHGRLSRQDYQGAQHLFLPFDHPGPPDRCPCGLSALKPCRETHLFLVGRPPVDGVLYHLDCRRCACGQIFRPQATPHQVLQYKYAPSAVAMMGILRHWHGLPGVRLQMLQQEMGIPLPDATQDDYLRALGLALMPVYRVLEVLAAQAWLLYADDTSARILSRIRQHRLDPSLKRYASHTTGIVAQTRVGLIVLYLIGAKHAGENLDRLLNHRQDSQPLPMVMGDGSACNTDHSHEVHHLNCMFHARQYFIKAANGFPDEVKKVLDLIGTVYKHDARAKADGLDSHARRAYHREHSTPVMKHLKAYLLGLDRARLVEPNSSMGKASRYMLNRWQGLTAFLRIPGAPLDNLPVERAIKKFVLIRKNSLFYKNPKSAARAGVIMSVIATCTAQRASPLDYLAHLYQNEADVMRHPRKWLPWNYQDRLAALAPRDSPARAHRSLPALGKVFQSLENTAFSGLPFHNRMFNSLTATSAKGCAPVLGHHTSLPLDNRLVQSQNPCPS